MKCKTIIFLYKYCSKNTFFTISWNELLLGLIGQKLTLFYNAYVSWNELLLGLIGQKLTPFYNAYVSWNELLLGLIGQKLTLMLCCTSF